MMFYAFQQTHTLREHEICEKHGIVRFWVCSDNCGGRGDEVRAPAMR